jgi:cytidine deaminase
MKRDTIKIKYSIFANENELSQEDRVLMDKAQEASLSAYAPYSKFRVGAAVLLGNGKIVAGNNQENASYPEGLCAERVALFAAAAQESNQPIKAIAIFGNQMDCALNGFVTPCGACRQVLAECQQRSKGNLRILCGGTAGEILMVESVQDLLPFQFKM